MRKIVVKHSMCMEQKCLLKKQYIRMFKFLNTSHLSLQHLKNHRKIRNSMLLIRKRTSVSAQQLHLTTILTLTTKCIQQMKQGQKIISRIELTVFKGIIVENYSGLIEFIMYVVYKQNSYIFYKNSIYIELCRMVQTN